PAGGPVPTATLPWPPRLARVPPPIDTPVPHPHAPARERLRRVDTRKRRRLRYQRGRSRSSGARAWLPARCDRARGGRGRAVGPPGPDLRPRLPPPTRPPPAPLALPPLPP